MKLQPGDYVSTEGMTEEQYHAVCKAFMEADAIDNEIMGLDYTNTIIWDGGSKTLWTSCFSLPAFKKERADGILIRELTIDQILNNEETTMDLQQAYKIMQDNCGIEVGDTVKVLRKAKDYENGWGCVGTFSSNYRKNGVVENIDEKLGIRVLFENDKELFPFFVLELVKKAPKLPEPIEISSMYRCEFKEDGSIAVGCQTLDFDLIEKIYLTAKEVKERE